MRAFIKYLDTIKKSVWNYRYLIELDNLASNNHTAPFISIEYTHEPWSQRFLNDILDRVEQSIASSKVVNLMYLTSAIKAYPIPAGGAITTQDFKDSTYKKDNCFKSYKQRQLLLLY